MGQSHSQLLPICCEHRPCHSGAACHKATTPCVPSQGEPPTTLEKCGCHVCCCPCRMFCLIPCMPCVAYNLCCDVFNCLTCCRCGSTNPAVYHVKHELDPNNVNNTCCWFKPAFGAGGGYPDGYKETEPLSFDSCCPCGCCYALCCVVVKREQFQDCCCCAPWPSKAPPAAFLSTFKPRDSVTTPKGHASNGSGSTTSTASNASTSSTSPRNSKPSVVGMEHRRTKTVTGVTLNGTVVAAAPKLVPARTSSADIIAAANATTQLDSLYGPAAPMPSAASVGVAPPPPLSVYPHLYSQQPAVAVVAAPVYMTAVVPRPPPAAYGGAFPPPPPAAYGAAFPPPPPPAAYGGAFPPPPPSPAARRY